jgi:E3 ubiquitin-protein ligase RNF103
VTEHDTSKGDVLLKQYMIRSSFSSGAIFRWIRNELASRVTMIDSISDLTGNWLRYQKSDDQIIRTKVILISRLQTPPLLLSALAIKFNGRATFGMYHFKTNDQRLQIMGRDFRVPLCLIALSNDSLYSYGEKAGEALHFKSMNLMMKTINPEPNDLFIMSLLLVNIVVSIDLFWMRFSKAWKHVCYWLIHAVKTNCLFLLIWLSFLTISGIPVIRSALNSSHWWLHGIACTRFAGILRHDAAIYYNRIPVIVAAYAVSCILFATIRRKFFCQPDSFDDDHLFREWSPLESTILTYILFRPIGMSIPAAATSFISQSNLDEDELIAPMMERFVFPNLWLQEDLISSEYINSLPLWLYNEPNHTGSESNNEEAADHQSSSVSEVSDSELASLSQTYSQPHSPSMDEFSPSKSGRKRSSGSRFKSTGVQKPSARDVSPINAAPMGTIRSTICPICLEAYRQNQVLCTLPCGHAYHDSCIFSWLLRDNHMCPTCRWPSNKAKTD